MIRYVISTLVLGYSTPVWADFYIGGSVGTNQLELTERLVDVDDSDSGWKVFAGYRFIDLLGVEASYVDFGSYEARNFIPDASTNLSASLKGFDAFAVTRFGLGPIGVFGKLGAVSWDTDITLVTFNIAGMPIVSTANSDGVDLAAGFGAEFSLGEVTFRGEAEWFNLSDVDELYLISAGVQINF